ncbi:MAG: hypothetical protein WCE54_07570 [Ignavibacteriaceae bacterium]
MKKNEIIAALEPLIKAFEELKILYYIGGSIASSAYGTARSTLNIDLVTNLLTHHIKPFTEKLKDEYYVDAEMIAEAIKTKSSFNLLHLQSMLKIDIFILKDSTYSTKEFERKVKDKLEEDEKPINIYLCSPEDIILNKLEWYKIGGKTSEKQWSDILGVIKVQAENLDRDFLKYWAKQLEVFELLVKAFDICKIKL